MILNESADWSRGEINVRPDMIKHFWTPDIIIHDLIRYCLRITQELQDDRHLILSSYRRIIIADLTKIYQ